MPLDELLYRELPEPAEIERCVFCQRIARGEFDYSNGRCVAFQPLQLVVRGHFLVVPKLHVANALESPVQTGHAMRFAAQLAGNMGLEDANFITSAGAAATQTVFHLHVHVVPRAEGDGLMLPWSLQERV